MKRSTMWQNSGIVILATTIVCLGLWSPAWGAVLQNGDMENFPVGTTRAANWTNYESGTTTNQYTRQTATVHGGLVAQGIKAKDAASQYAGVYQTIDANVGDAITFVAYARPTARPDTQGRPSLGAQWNGSTSRPGAWLAQATLQSQKNTWVQLQGAGNATSGSVTVFLDVARIGAADTTTYWDDVAEYHAYVPPMPSVGGATASSLDVDVDPGSNSGNSLAEYAITIGGGAYALGADWLQPGGAIGGTAAWQTDLSWATTTVSSLAASTEYSFEVVARYSGTYTQATTAGPAGTGITLPEPTMIALLSLGALGLLRRGRL